MKWRHDDFEQETCFEAPFSWFEPDWFGAVNNTMYSQTDRNGEDMAAASTFRWRPPTSRKAQELVQTIDTGRRALRELPHEFDIIPVVGPALRDCCNAAIAAIDAIRVSGTPLPSLNTTNVQGIECEEEQDGVAGTRW